MTEEQALDLAVWLGDQGMEYAAVREVEGGTWVVDCCYGSKTYYTLTAWEEHNG